MRLAILSDIHGNSVALEAVLEHAARHGGADRYWILGDIAALGPDPAGAIARVRSLPETACLGGNTERYTLTGDLPAGDVPSGPIDRAQAEHLVEVAASFAWTRGYLAATGDLEWLTGLPAELRTTLPEGSRLLGVHASPGRDDGSGLGAGKPAEALREIAAAAAADVVCAGHTHVPFDCTVDGVRLVNAGAVGLPAGGDLRASYVLLEASETAYELEHRLVPYDNEAVAAELRRVRHPAAEWLAAKHRLP